MHASDSSDSIQSLTEDFRQAAYALGISGEAVERMSKSPERALACVEETSRLGKGPGLAVHMFDAGDWPKEKKTKGHLTNAHAPQSDCKTCDGDRFVIVGMRAAGSGVTGANYEEWAPCPDCNSQDISYQRPDGTRFNPPSPAKVRQLMKDFPR